jgi:cytochrome c oxidase subunit 2
MRGRNFWFGAIYITMLVGICTFGVKSQDSEKARRIEITAQRYSFNPNEITIKRGETVVLAIRSTDVTHGFEVKELGAKSDIPNGRVTEIRLTPTETGDFAGLCNHFCGVGHGGMTFMVHVID